MLLLLCTAGVEIMRHSSVAASAPQQTRAVCIRYLRFCEGEDERCIRSRANLDPGEAGTVRGCDARAAGVVFTRGLVNRDTVSSSTSLVWSGQREVHLKIRI